MKSLTPEESEDLGADQSDDCFKQSSFSRHPSLAEIPAITSNCSTSPIMTREKESNINRDPKSAALDSEIARTENTIAFLASQSHESQESSHIKPLVPATPPKTSTKQASTSTTTPDEPLTPTANLKMLVSAASPAIRDREIKKRELFTDSPTPTSPSVVPAFALPVFDSKVVYRNGSYLNINTQDGTENMAISRKDKSLGLLCQRFLAKYPENPSPDQRIEISLDEVAKDLSVERRRIYDIVNVLESVEVISRFAKNRYMWHGKTKLPQTLAKLKCYAMNHGFSNKGGSTENEKPAINKISYSDKENPSLNLFSQLKGNKLGQNDKLRQLLPKNAKMMIPGMGLLSNFLDNEDDEMSAWARKQKEADYCRKDKSLGVLSQKFLMMFLISESRQVTLDDAANLLIDEQEEGKAKYKTKVRRLYDIANILSSLQLIQKVHIHNIQSGRKPGFRWIGMDLDKLEMEVKKTKVTIPTKTTKTSSKNSLLDKELDNETACCRFLSRRPSQQQLRQSKSGTVKSKLPRSRSDRVLMCKKRVLSCDGESAKNNEEDGYSVQEIIKANNESKSPDSVKFHSELMKLKQQYPDRMSQLLSACSTLQAVPTEDKKSRRTLFVSEAYIDAPMPKRQRTSDSDSNDSTSNSDKFVHSFTSPFKPFNNDKPSKPTAESQHNGQAVKQGSPEQKILLERKKQAKLLEEQKNFQLEDDRWKRMEHELDKAFPKNEPKVTNTDTPNLFDRVYPSVGIQASLISDISPLKPLRQYANCMPINKNCVDKQVTIPATSNAVTPANLQNMVLSPLVNNTTNETVMSSANVSSGNVKLVSLSSANLPPIWKMTNCSVPPIPNSQPIYLTVSQQQQLAPAGCNNGNFPSTPMQPVTEGTTNCFSNMLQSNATTLQPTTVSLPINIVNSLNAQGLLQTPCQDGKTRQVLKLHPAGFTPRMSLANMSTLSGVQPMAATPNQMTPILPKVPTQQMFPPMASATPITNPNAFMHSEIVKKLVMSDTKMTQS